MRVTLTAQKYNGADAVTVFENIDQVEFQSEDSQFNDGDDAERFLLIAKDHYSVILIEDSPAEQVIS